MTYRNFLVANRGILSFGILLTFSSSFGQTFLISLFVPYFLNEFSLSHAQFGNLYSAATLLAAAFLPVLGSWIDRTHLRDYSIAVAAGLAFSCLLVYLSTSVPVLLVALLALRLAGQGLLSHTATTSVARHFTSLRGKALSVVSLGFPLGEGILPLLIVWLIHEAGWRNSWLIIAGYSALVVVPLVNRLLRETKWKDAEPQSPEGSSLTINTGWSRREIFRDPRFYLLLPVVLTLPFVLTGLFLFQVPLAESKGWSTAIMATAFAGFALGRIGSSLLSGPLVDRLGAVRLLPTCLVPLAFGVAGLAFLSQTWVPVACFFLAGVSQGLSGTIKSAIHAEMYGVGQLGTIRSLIAAVMVLGTALSPALFGWLFDRGVPFEVVSYMILLLIGIATTSAWWVSVRTPEDGCSVRREAGTPREAS